ncbi:formin-like protein 7 [Telopea speciosissima]|uniref:formin-like protein 7 n=1 Tax=Telopea speciosissima TaxID=54955 RepID=UPI001CC52289|nr:formin-like protein 7 [Telopea speciosissima]
MVDTRNRNHSPPRDDVSDVSEEALPAPPPVNTNADEGQQLPPPVHVAPVPSAATTPVIPPPAPAAVKVPGVQVVPNPPPPTPAAPRVQNAVPEWADASKLSEKFQKHRPPTFYKLIHDSMFPAT